MNSEVIQLLRGIADSEEDFVQEGDTVIFLHHGTECALQISHIPGIGAAIRQGDSGWVAVEKYVQENILKLPLLAKQIIREIQKKQSQRAIQFEDGLKTIPFVDGPAALREKGEWKVHDSSKGLLKTLLMEPPLGTTQIIEMMAPAGQGKTILLESVAIECAHAYFPDKNPMPLLLVIDLLGRYVGTVHDAIAGALNNDYKFPGLTGRDVATCVQQRWINLALDGFDELVARVGTREAFLRIKELVDELGRAGVVVLSARETFFDLFEIETSMRTYLQPQRGAYTIRDYRLESWGDKQAEQVFKHLGSTDSHGELQGLLEVFENDKELVYRPVFTTKLVSAWRQGERFASAGGVGRNQGLSRHSYVINVFLEREASEKWRSREEANKFDLSIEGHISMLGAVAEEMWRSSAFALTKDELDLSGRIGLADHNVPSPYVDDLIAKLPTHSFFQNSAGKGIKFAHETFFEYVLGHRLSALIVKGDSQSLKFILDAGDISQTVIDWSLWKLNEVGKVDEALAYFEKELNANTADSTVNSNVSNFIGALAKFDFVVDRVIKNGNFAGDSLLETRFKGVKFVNCVFWVIDLCGSQLIDCEFSQCQFGKMLVDGNTSLERSRADSFELTSLETKNGEALFIPHQISEKLNSLGFAALAKVGGGPPKPSVRKVDAAIVRCLDKFRRAKSTDISIDEMTERYSDHVPRLVDIGIQHGIFKQSERDTAGARQSFFRYVTDRERVMSGLRGALDDAAIDGFWGQLEKEFP